MSRSMQLRINNLRRPVDEPEAELPAAIARRLRLPVGEIASWRILPRASTPGLGAI
ncbi:MAG: hypothetical protein R3B90_11905 [Planctomycetaceae bacterium]